MKHKEKRYDIQFKPEELESLLNIFHTMQSLEHVLDEGLKKDLLVTREIYWKLHNKLVE